MSGAINYGKLRSEARRERKSLFIQRCAMQAKVAKAMTILSLKGKNGMSMSAELLAQHGIDGPMKAKLAARERKEGA